MVTGIVGAENASDGYNVKHSHKQSTKNAKIESGSGAYLSKKTAGHVLVAKDVETF
jgi:hypothetical protein